MVSSEEKPQNFPIYAVHSDMDSFILFNDDISPMSDKKSIILEQDQHMSEQSSSQEIKIEKSSNESVLEDKPDKKQELQFIIPSHREAVKTPLNQEILWFLEVDGSVNKLGA